MALKKIISWIKQLWEDYWLEFETLDYETKEMLYFENLYRNR